MRSAHNYLFLLCCCCVIFFIAAARASAKTDPSVQPPNHNTVVVPSNLRGPLDTWETTFQLRKVWENHHPSVPRKEDVPHRRFIFLNPPPSFERNITEGGRGHNQPADPFDPFWTGRATEDPNIVLEFHEDVVEHPEEYKEKNPLEGIYLYLNPHAWGTPCFRSTIQEIDSEVTVAQSEIICPHVSDKGFNLKYAFPEDIENLILKPWNDENDGPTWKVTVELERAESTTFSFVSPGGIEGELLTSHEKYDVTPENASLGFKFMFQAAEDDRMLEIWAFRKPPMPDFRLSVYTNHKVAFSEAINDVGRTANAFGVRHDLEDEEHPYKDVIGKEVAMFATFVEKRRQFISHAIVDNFVSSIAPELLGDSAQNKEGQNFREAVLQSSSEDLAEIAPDAKNVEFVFRHFPHTKFTGFYMRFPFPVKNVLVSFWILNKNDDGETKKTRRNLFLREGDADIPHGGAGAEDSIHHLYGWDDALPVVTRTQDGEELASPAFHEVMENAFEIEVQYDKIQHESHETLATVMKSWIDNAGGNAYKLDLDFLDVPHHSHAKPHPLRLTQRVAEWDEEAHSRNINKYAIAVVPMYNIFTASVAMKSGWGELIARNSETLNDFISQEKLRPESVQFMYLTLASLSHVYDGSHNFRPLFRVFEQSAINLPPLYHTEELNLFSFSDAFASERSRMINMWNEEYEVLLKLENKLRREVSREMYFFHRSQIEARAVNGTNGEMQLIPIIDLVPHSDTPSAEVRFDDQEGSVLLAALHPMKAKDEVTIDYGTSHLVPSDTPEKATQVSKSRLGFLLQHGFIPESATASVGISLKNKNGVQRVIALFQNHNESIEDFLRFFYHGERFNDELTEEELVHVPSSLSDIQESRTKVLELLENKLSSLPSDIPDVSDSILMQREKEKHAAAEAHRHHRHHHNKHLAHRERPLEKLRASFDAAREHALLLLKSEKETLEYFVDVLKKMAEGHSE